MSLSILTFMQFNLINRYWKTNETRVFWTCWEGSSSTGRIWPKGLNHPCESWPKAPAVSDACVCACVCVSILLMNSYVSSVSVSFEGGGMWQAPPPVTKTSHWNQIELANKTWHWGIVTVWLSNRDLHFKDKLPQGCCRQWEGRGEPATAASSMQVPRKVWPRKDDGSLGANRVPRISLGTMSQHQVPSTQTLGLSTPGEVGRMLKTPGLASEQLLRIHWLRFLGEFLSGLPNQRTGGVI